ncbi:nickel ABC transporter permease [Faecalimonas sp.]
MLKIILKRILQLIPVLFIVIAIVFTVTRLIPGNPAMIILGPQASVEAVEKLTEELGLNESIPKQFAMYLGGVLKGDFGTSYRYNQPVLDLLLEKLPNTLYLTVASIIIALLIGIPVGIISAVKQYSIFDYTAMFGALIGVSIPSFWLGLMLVLIFSVNLGWLPSIGMGEMANGIGDMLKHLILPAFCLSTGSMAEFARITRSSMLEVINQDYIKAVRAKGIKENKVIIKHALKNAMPPIITVIGMRFSFLMGGAILVETIFTWPGMGRLIVDAIGNKDYAVIQGCVLFMAIFYVLINLIVDIIYTYLNPKVSYENEGGGH